METQQTNKTLFLSHALLFSVAHESHLSYAMTILTTAHIHFIAGISKDQYMRKGGAPNVWGGGKQEKWREKDKKVDGGVLAQVTKWIQAFIFER